MIEIVPSSERSSSSGAAPLPKSIKPLLESKLEEIKSVLAGLVPEKKKRNILEEAIYEDDGLGGFESEIMIQGTQLLTMLNLIRSIRISPHIPAAITYCRRCRDGPTVFGSRNTSPSREDTCSII